jgi:hypothetical protein
MARHPDVDWNLAEFESPSAWLTEISQLPKFPRLNSLCLYLQASGTVFARVAPRDAAGKDKTKAAGDAPTDPEDDTTVAPEYQDNTMTSGTGALAANSEPGLQAGDSVLAAQGKIRNNPPVSLPKCSQ